MRIIGGTARGKKIEAPLDESTRPALDSTREAIFNILADEIEGCRVLDLFAGVGAFGLEALSRGARSATFVDQSLKVLEVLERNVKSLGFTHQTTVLCSDALATPVVKEVDHPFGLVFLDPPFPLFAESSSAERVLQRVVTILRSRATNERSRVVLRVPSDYGERLPFPSFDSRVYGLSRVVFLKQSDLTAQL